MDIEDDDIPNISFDLPKGYKSSKTDAAIVWNNQAVITRNRKRMEELQDRFTEILDRSLMDDIQLEMLSVSILFGVPTTSCVGYFSNHLNYSQSLSEISGDTTDENMLLKAIISGICMGTEFNKYQARRFNNEYLYRSLNQLLDDPEYFNSIIAEIIEVWDENLELYEDSDYLVCYRGNVYELDKLTDLIGSELRIRTNDPLRKPNSFEDFLNDFSYNTPQEAVDDWNRSLIYEKDLVQMDMDGGSRYLRNHYRTMNK